MLIPLSYLTEKYQFETKTVLHIGAHKCEELKDYLIYGADRIHWIEADKKLYRKLKWKLDRKINQITCAVISDRDGDKVDFNITNNRQSSSILKLKHHTKVYPDIVEVKSEKRKTATIDSIMEKSIIGNDEIDLLNLDIQGAELLALKGATKTLSNVKRIVTEINEKELYDGCPMISEIDSYLNYFGFERVEKEMSGDAGWGDAFYIK